MFLLELPIAITALNIGPVAEFDCDVRPQLLMHNEKEL
jgi:hypothetical protein